MRRRTVIVPKPKATLTVSTCYPFSYIGSAPQRYVLIADLINSEKQDLLEKAVDPQPFLNWHDYSMILATHYRKNWTDYHKI